MVPALWGCRGPRDEAPSASLVQPLLAPVIQLTRAKGKAQSISSLLALADLMVTPILHARAA